MPVRVAELTPGGEAILYACGLPLEEERQILLGLSTKCEHHLSEGGVFLNSLIKAEHDVRATLKMGNECCKKIDLTEAFNSVSRGF